MAWDKTLPDGTLSIAQGDDDIRENNDSLEIALDLEHRFTTGGNQSGRHVFYYGTSAGVAGLADVDDGSIAFEESSRGAGNPVLRVREGGVWRQLDVAQDVARLDEANDWSAPNNFEWVSVTPAAGTPDTLAVDLTLSSYKYATISGDTEISNPSGAVAGYAQNVLLQITNSGAGHTITWGSAYRAPNGVAPIYDDSDAAVNIFSLTILQTGGVLVTTAMDVSSF